MRSTLLMSAAVVAMVTGQFLPGNSTMLMAQGRDQDLPDWNRYHSAKEVASYLEEWSRVYPKLTRLIRMGETRRGTPLWILEITNRETGPGSDKPAYYYDGNIHSSELTSAEVALHFAFFQFCSGDDVNTAIRSDEGRRVNSHADVVPPGNTALAGSRKEALSASSLIGAEHSPGVGTVSGGASASLNAFEHLESSRVKDGVGFFLQY